MTELGTERVGVEMEQEEEELRRCLFYSWLHSTSEMKCLQLLLHNSTLTHTHTPHSLSFISGHMRPITCERGKSQITHRV